MSKHVHSTDDRCQLYHPQKSREKRTNRLFPKLLVAYVENAESYLLYTVVCPLFFYGFCWRKNVNWIMRYFKFQKYNQFNDAYILLFKFLYCGLYIFLVSYSRFFFLSRCFLVEHLSVVYAQCVTILRLFYEQVCALHVIRKPESLTNNPWGKYVPNSHTKLWMEGKLWKSKVSLGNFWFAVGYFINLNIW